MAVAIAPDGIRALIGDGDGIVTLWDTETGEERELIGHRKGVVHAADVHPTGLYGLTSGADNTVRLWDLERGEEIARLLGHIGGVTDVRFTLDGRRAVSASVACLRRNSASAALAAALSSAVLRAASSVAALAVATFRKASSSASLSEAAYKHAKGCPG